jgi:hypothetical protein
VIGSDLCSCLDNESQYGDSGKQILSGRWPGKGLTDTDLEVLVGSLLPLLVHGVWCGLGEHAHGAEDGQGGQEADEKVEGDLLALIGGRKGTGAVRAERNPVGC